MSPESLLADKLTVYRAAFDKAMGSPDAAEVRGALRFIAEDFAHEFNAKLAAAARNDPTVELVADKYEMGRDHVAELEELLAAPIAPLLTKLDAGDAEGARRAADGAWARLEKRIRSKWQAYFILTFQDVSVERKAARDRKKLQPRFDPELMEALARSTTAAEPSPRGMSPWVAVMALLLLAAAGGWFLMRGHARHAAAAAVHAAAVAH
ncbi:MAG TPA: hypothetical protein VF334_20070 [Polyangia bacterium]